MGTTESFPEEPPTPSTHSGASSSAVYPPSPPRRRPLALSGIVLALPKSGKRTLLQRLQGKDPFAEDRSSGDRSVEERSVTIPYVSGQTCWDRIQLHIQATRIPQRLSSIDFGVILLDPRQKQETSKEYLSLILQTIFQEKKKAPICLCILLNFRDLKEKHHRKAWTTESHVKTWTMECLQKHDWLDPSRLVLVSGETSLLNCYGLPLLHHFMYQSYLCRKQWDLEQQMAEIRNAQLEARTLPEMPSYKKFVRLAQGKPLKSRSGKKSEQTIEPSQGRRRVVLVPYPPKKEEEKEEGVPLFGETEALESFLGSDSDDDKNGEVPKHQVVDEDDSETYVVEQVLSADQTPQKQSNEKLGKDTRDETIASDEKTKEREKDEPTVIAQEQLEEDTHIPPNLEETESSGEKKQTENLTDELHAVSSPKCVDDASPSETTETDLPPTQGSDERTDQLSVDDSGSTEETKTSEKCTKETDVLSPSDNEELPLSADGLSVTLESISPIVGGSHAMDTFLKDDDNESANNISSVAEDDDEDDFIIATEQTLPREQTAPTSNSGGDPITTVKEISRISEDQSQGLSSAALAAVAAAQQEAQAQLSQSRDISKKKEKKRSKDQGDRKKKKKEKKKS